MSQFSKVNHSRNQWKGKAKQRGDDNRYLRKQIARLKAERNRAKQELKDTQARLHQMESQVQTGARRLKVDGVWLSLRLFLEVRISFRAVCRVLSLLAADLGLHKAPCPQTLINWVVRLSIVRIESARERRGLPLRQAPFSNGLIWIIDLSIALGSGKILAVLALDAHHHHLATGAPSLNHVHCIAVSVAESWTGDAIAEVLKRLIAQIGRPAAYLKDGGRELQKAVDGLGPKGWRASASTISPTPPPTCSSATTSTTRPSSASCRPVGASRASLNKPSWRVWHPPPYAPRPAL